LSLGAFFLVYTVIFGAGTYYILKLIGKGPDMPEDASFGTHGLKKPLLVVDRS